jgi:ribokinase
MNIVNFGSCNIDYVYKLNHIVNVGETEHSDRMEIFPGGKGLNQSIAVAKAGAKVYHAGFIGKDGQLLLDTMNECGVDTSFVKRVNQPNGHAIIQVSEKGENSIFIHTGSNGLFTKEYIDDVLFNFKSGDILLLQNEINDIDYIIKRGYEKGMITVFNPSPIDASLEKIDFNMISYAVLNEIEGEYLTGCKEPAKIISTLRKYYPKLKIVLTLGDKGCMYHDGENLYCNSAYDVIVVDSTAAGDTFTGYFISEMAKGREMSDVLRVASCASAITVSRPGASVSIPRYDEVMAALNIMKVKE